VIRLPNHAEANLAALIESTSDLIWCVDLEFRLLNFNQALRQNCERNFGVQADLGMRPEDLLPPEKAAEWPPLYGRALSEGAFRVEYSLADGRTLELVFNPIFVDGQNAGVSVFGKDITGQKAAKDSNRLLASIVESSDDALFAVKLDGTIASWNRGAELLYGYSAAEVIGETSNILVPPDLIEDFREKYEALMTGRSLFQLDTLARHKNGSMVDVALTISPIRDANEIVSGASVVVKDIGGHKRLERELEEAERKYRAIFNGALEGMFRTSPEGGLLNANPALARMLGYESPAELISAATNVTKVALVDVEERSRLTRELDADGAVRGFECRFMRKDGRIIWGSLTFRRVRDADGRLLFHEGFIEDVTARRKSEMALAERENRFRKLFEKNGSVFLLIDPWSGLIVEANQSAIAFYGYPHERLIGMSIAQINTLGHEAVESQWLRALRGERSHFKFRHRLASGEERDVEVYSSPIETEGKTLLFSVVHDVTDRHRAEEALRESGELLKEAQNIGTLGTYLLDFVTGMWASSDVMDEIFGIDKEHDCSVAGWVRLIHPDDREMMTAYFENEVAGKRNPFDKEYRIVRQNDHVTRWVHGLGKLELDVQGQLLKMRGIIQDITERKQGDMQLRESEERYRATFEQAAIGILHTSLDGRILRCNASFADIIGYSQDEVPGLSFQQITWPEDLSHSVKVQQAISNNATGSESWEKRYIRKDGSLTWVKLKVSTQRDAEGNALHFICLVEDINARKKSEALLSEAQEALRLSEARYRTVFETSLDAISISRLSDERYVEVNKAFLEITGFAREEIIGRTARELGIWEDPHDRDDLIGILRLTSERRNQEFQFRKKNGDRIWGLLSASVIEIDGVACVLGVTRDISDAKLAEEEIRNLAFYDPLTGLPNRRLLLERLHQAANSMTVRMRALLFVDVDNFKVLNDTLGHHTGDLLLQEIALRLTACVREVDTVARLGGDEFVVMLESLSYAPEQAAADAKAMGEKILAAVDRPYLLDGREFLSTSSIGITVFGDRRETMSEVMQQADIAMYQAKAAGRNTMRFFSPALQAAVHARAAMEVDLRKGIKADEFQLYYQPQIDRGLLVGAEALLRWNHPRRGTLLPGEFISAAEESGLILPLGGWVLDAACRQIAAWADRTETSCITVAVNISALQLRQPDFVETVLAAVDRAGANPQYLDLELTESMLVDNIEDVIAKMTSLKAHGVRFSLDDFGTGYSSLSYLKRLPLDHLKIDRSFVRDVLVDASSGAIAQTIISLSRTMELSVMAEGVETEEQREFLAHMGCHAFQGYLFSRPLPLQDFELLLARWPVASAPRMGIAAIEQPIPEKLAG
jgi:diguanylate cyclase (GGDEF)-like protein/PAS domain S-box-containing protein